ncbi:MAG: DNA mismatch repair protein MutS [Rhodobacterales bacterium 32-67-9]|nr:MAG: DNA mismatch repair protein MutS [Rhodobacterales bacterium 32-67-9]
MNRRKRGLSAEERELWGRVAASARPIRPVHAPIHEAGPRQKPKPVHPKPQPSDFHIGQLARPMTAAHDLVPAIEERLAAQPVRIDRRTHQQLTRGKLRPEARIDLHGLTLAEAHPELIRFILNAHGTGKRLVLVITGKGKRGDDHGPIPQRVGVLRHQMPHWLTQPPLGALVLQVTPAHLKHGGGGAFYVYLKRRA